MPSSLKRRRWLWGSLVGALLLLILMACRPGIHMARTMWHDTDQVAALPQGVVDDASRLNEAHVLEVWNIPEDSQAAQLQLAALLERARAEGLHVSIAGARHSMGGHTIYPGGIAINMLPLKRMELDERTNLLHVQAGAKWSEIIPYLDQRGRSIEVMQSDNSFTVGGSISVNCHGWQYDRPPIASTVESLRLMKADGTIVTCSRRENQELFSLVLGGYGLLGVILDVDLRVIPNERLRLEQVVVPVDDALASFDRATEKPGIRMMYARMNIVPDTLFRNVIINAFYHDSSGPIPSLTQPGLVKLRRALFRGSAESDYGKQLRWEAETRLQPYLTKSAYSRNQLLSEGVEVYENRSADSTDILHEYFVPRETVAKFVGLLHEIIPKSHVDLLNVTVRSINADNDTYLRYADRDMLALVMLFDQPRNAAAEAQMEAMTQQIIEAAIRCRGRYYLPYRLHATVDQFQRAYPQAREFFELKRKYDPQELFENQFYLKYAKSAGSR